MLVPPKGFRSRNPASHTGRGFTLIELLVVVAIIAILAAILFPVFAQAREKARQTACMSNCKQIGTALMMYSQDCDECLPRGFSGGSSAAAPGRDWSTDLLPYIKAGGLNDAYQVNASLAATRPDLFTAANPFYQCPSKAESRDASRGFRRGYAYNHWLAATGTAVALSDIKQPSDHLAFGEVYGEVDRLFPFGCIPLGCDSRFVPEARHNKGLNITFCDGHAKWVNGTDPKMQWPTGITWSNQPIGTYFWPVK